MDGMTAKGLRRAARTVARVVKWVLWNSKRDRPVSLRTIQRLRSVLRVPDAMAPTFRQARASSDQLADPRLANLLGDEELGTWSLGPRTIDLLGRQIERLRPRLILELGSGISTVCLAFFMSALHADDEPRVISIEQSEEMSNRTRERLAQARLGNIARVVTRPLAEQTALGRASTCYDLRSLDGIVPRPVDLVLIDGPSGEPGVRFATLPLVARHMADGATFLLDDALRDAELEIAATWSSVPGFKVNGIIPIETGILTGTVRSHEERGGTWTAST